MNTLVLIPGRKSLRYARFTGQAAITGGTIRGFRWQGAHKALEEIRSIVRGSGFFDGPSTAIAIHGVYGGEEFTGPAPLGPDTYARLERIAPLSPLHVANVIELARAVEETFVGIPAVLAFDTSFFVDLPARERTYAVSTDLAAKMGIRRWGYHGLLHEAAAVAAGRNARRVGNDEPQRVLSICLDARPEIAAIVGKRPVMVTSGATPLEGLPGETHCGEIDPAIALALAHEGGLGPEGTNALLTGESGLCGLAGRRVRLDDVLTGRSVELQRAREVLLYRMLLAVGAAAAAMGGVDAVMFCGPYVGCAPTVARAILPRLEATGALASAVNWDVYPGNLERILADLAVLCVRPPAEELMLTG
jgi:acetate kinase